MAPALFQYRHASSSGPVRPAGGLAGEDERDPEGPGAGVRERDERIVLSKISCSEHGNAACCVRRGLPGQDSAKYLSLKNPRFAHDMHERIMAVGAPLWPESRKAASGPARCHAGLLPRCPSAGCPNLSIIPRGIDGRTLPDDRRIAWITAGQSTTASARCWRTGGKGRNKADVPPAAPFIRWTGLGIRQCSTALSGTPP